MKKLSLTIFFCLLLLFSFVSSAQAVNLKPLVTYSPVSLIGFIIQIMLGIMGAVALVMFVYGGFMMMSSAGNASKVAKGKEILIWAVIGMAFIIGSFMILSQLVFPVLLTPSG